MAVGRIFNIDTANTNGEDLADILEAFSLAVVTGQLTTGNQPSWAARGFQDIQDDSGLLKFRVSDGTNARLMFVVNPTTGMPYFAASSDGRTRVAHHPTKSHTVEVVSDNSTRMTINKTGMSLSSTDPAVTADFSAGSATRSACRAEPRTSAPTRPSSSTYGATRTRTTSSITTAPTGRKSDRADSTPRKSGTRWPPCWGRAATGSPSDLHRLRERARIARHQQRRQRHRQSAGGIEQSILDDCEIRRAPQHPHPGGDGPQEDAGRQRQAHPHSRRQEHRGGRGNPESGERQRDDHPQRDGQQSHDRWGHRRQAEDADHRRRRPALRSDGRGRDAHQDRNRLRRGIVRGQRLLQESHERRRRDQRPDERPVRGRRNHSQLFDRHPSDQRRRVHRARAAQHSRRGLRRASPVQGGGRLRDRMAGRRRRGGRESATSRRTRSPIWESPPPRSQTPPSRRASWTRAATATTTSCWPPTGRAA